MCLSAGRGSFALVDVGHTAAGRVHHVLRGVIQLARRRQVGKRLKLLDGLGIVVMADQAPRFGVGPLQIAEASEIALHLFRKINEKTNIYGFILCI